MNEQEQTSQSILIVDDHVLFRDGLIGLFNSTQDFHVVGEAGTVDEGVEKALRHKPDIILMDFSLPDGTGLDATKYILDEMPDCKIIFLTVYETDENLLNAIKLGAKGYLLKNVSSSSLMASLRALAHGEIAMSRKMMSRALEASNLTPPTIPSELLEKLSSREIEVLYELRSGRTNAEIAQRLYLSENTVKHHVRSIFGKLDVDNRREARQIAQKLDVKRNMPDD